MSDAQKAPREDWPGTRLKRDIWRMADGSWGAEVMRNGVGVGIRHVSLLHATWHVVTVRRPDEWGTLTVESSKGEADVTRDLYRAIVEAEIAARRAHDLSYALSAPFWTRISLGRVQTILMRYVVKHAGAFGPYSPRRANAVNNTADSAPISRTPGRER